MSAARSRSDAVSHRLTAESFMEFVGRPRSSEACSLLAVPGLSCLDVDEDDGDEIVGIRPKSSPIPSRKSSFTDEDSEPELPLCGSRRVSFADAKGLSLVQVKEFDTWDVPKLPGYQSTVTDGTDVEEYFLSPSTFTLPLPSDELFARVHEQKIELESIELLPGTTILKGVVRVLNISYNKSVYVRTTLDNWSNHFDLLAEYVPGSSDGSMDCFSFKLTLVPPFGDQGARAAFCLRYETPVGTFWANNNNKNYVLFCHRRLKEEKEKAKRDGVNKKSCLKALSQNVSTVENISPKQASPQENVSTGEGEDRPEAPNISEGQSVTSREEDEKSSVESRQNSSRQRQRKAARTARARGYFAQRDGGDSDRDESPPEIKQATQGKIPVDKHVCVQPFSEGGGESVGPRFVCEVLKTRSEPLCNAARDQMCGEQPEKPDPAMLARGGSATGLPSNSLCSAEEAAPAEQLHVGEFHTKTPEGSQNPDMTFTRATNTGGAWSESPVSQSNRFTLDTAPLCHRVFNQTLSQDPVNSEAVCDDAVPPNPKNKSIRGQRDSTENQESKHDAILDSSKDKETTEALKCTNVDLKLTEKGTNTPEGPRRPLGDAVNAVLDLLNPQTASESEHLQETAQEINLTFDLHGQTPADPQEQEQTLTDGTRPASETQGEESRENSCVCTEVREDHDADKTVRVSDGSSPLKEDKLLKDDLNCNQTDKTVAKSRINELVSDCESVEETGRREEGAVPLKDDRDNPGDGKITNQESHDDTFEGIRVKNTLGTIERHEIEATELKLDENFFLADKEMMIQDEGKTMFRNEAGSEPLSSKAQEAAAEDEATSEEHKLKSEDEVDEIVSIEDREQTREGEAAEFSAGKEFKFIKGIKAEKIVWEIGKTEEDKNGGSEDTEMKKMRCFPEMQQVSTEQQSVQEKEGIEKNMEIHLNYEGKAGAEQRRPTDYREKITVSVERDTETSNTDSHLATEGREDEAGSFKGRSEVTQNKAEDSLSAPVSHDPEAVEDNTGNGGHACIRTHDGDARSKGESVLPGEPESDPTSDDGSESDSGDEVELYMHCLRAAGASAHKDKAKDGGFTASRRLSLSRGRPTLMPSIHESLDEDAQTGGPQQDPDNMQTAAPAGGRGNSSHTFSRKALFYSTLLVVFVVVSYHYDFLACFGLYMISVIWLCWQRERKPVQNNSRAR